MVQAWQTDVAESISTTHFEGSPASAVRELRSGRVAEVALPAGRLIVPGTAETQAKLPTSAAEVLKALGITVLMPLKSETSTDFAIKEPVLYLQEGEIWVVVEAAVTDGQQALCRHAVNGGNNVLGRFRGDADTGAAVVPAARFTSTQATPGGLAKLKINLPATA